MILLTGASDKGATWSAPGREDSSASLTQLSGPLLWLSSWLLGSCGNWEPDSGRPHKFQSDASTLRWVSSYSTTKNMQSQLKMCIWEYIWIALAPQHLSFTWKRWRALWGTHPLLYHWTQSYGPKGAHIHKPCIARPSTVSTWALITISSFMDFSKSLWTCSTIFSLTLPSVHAPKVLRTIFWKDKWVFLTPLKPYNGLPWPLVQTALNLLTWPSQPASQRTSCPPLSHVSFMPGSTAAQNQ